jgi:hypothetical protein
MLPALLIAALSLGAASSPPGDVDLSEAQKDLARARQLYLRLEIADALPAVRRAAYAFEESLPATQQIEPFARAIALLAACELEAGHADEAKRAWLRLLRLRPAYEPEPSLSSPKVLASFSQAHAAAAATVRGPLEIISTPPGASVKVDGTSRGTTPLELEGLPLGDHAVRLDLEGHRPWYGMVSIRASANRVEIPFESAEPAHPGQPSPAANDQPVAAQASTETAPTLKLEPTIDAKRSPLPLAAEVQAPPTPGPPLWMWVGGGALAVAGGVLLAASLVSASHDQPHSATPGGPAILHSLSYSQAQRLDDLGYGGEALLGAGGLVLLGSAGWQVAVAVISKPRL